ncbi:hypothetical protein GCM10020000_74770 [Streptomyces olivoverticillatus]
MTHDTTARSTAASREEMAGDPIALHRRNAARLGARDIVIAAYPGSGAALIGNILIELGFDYIDPYSEVVAEGGQAQVIEDHLAYRSRLAATAAGDRSTAAGKTGDEPGSEPRFFSKTTSTPLTSTPPAWAARCCWCAIPAMRCTPPTSGSVVSHGCGWARTPRARAASHSSSLGTGINGEPPVADWYGLYDAWLDALGHFARSAVVRFEDLKADPEATTARLLDALGAPRTPDRLERAARRSSYEHMRAHEEQATTTPHHQRGGRASCGAARSASGRSGTATVSWPPASPTRTCCAPPPGSATTSPRPPDPETRETRCGTSTSAAPGGFCNPSPYRRRTLP